MKVKYINNDGGGFADYVETREGITVAEFFGERVPSRAPNDYLIRVNWQVVTPDEVLKEGDRISFTPLKIEGAGR